MTADELRFKQVVLNLLSNAVKFTPDGGSVTVATRIVDGDLLVTVADTGIGIAPEDRERIFESFQQGPRGTSTQEGTGLGLTLCRRIVELMGGRIWLETELGAGSTFGFTIPVRSMPTIDSGAARQVGQAETTAVLVIEDDRRSADLLSAYLVTAGFTVELAHDGVAGLEIARENVPLAIVLDIRLPGVDGWEVLRRLKSDSRTKEIPVLVVSVVDERPRGLSLGAIDYLVKPISRDEILSSLAAAGVTADASGASLGATDR